MTDLVRNSHASIQTIRNPNSMWPDSEKSKPHQQTCTHTDMHAQTCCELTSPGSTSSQTTAEAIVTKMKPKLVLQQGSLLPNCQRTNPTNSWGRGIISSRNQLSTHNLQSRRFTEKKISPRPISFTTASGRAPFHDQSSGRRDARPRW